MTRIKHKVVSQKGEAVTLLVDTPARWGASSALYAANADEEKSVGAALLALNDKRIGDARQLLGRFSDAPTLAVTLITLARCSVAEGDLAGAEALLKRAESRFPQESRVWKALAVLHRLQGRPLDELTYRRSLLLLVPQPAFGAYVGYAQAYADAYRDQPEPPLGEIEHVAAKLEAQASGDEADRRERLQFAQVLYAFRPLHILAIRHYRLTSPRPPEARDVSVAWMPLHYWCERQEVPCRRAAELGRPRLRPMLAELGRVAVVPEFQWIPLLDEEKVAIEGFALRDVELRADMPASPVLLNHVGRRAELRIPKELPVIERPTLLLGGSSRYVEHTLGFLGSLAIAETLGLPDGLALAVNDDLAPFQLEQFAMLGIDESRLVRVKAGEPQRFSRLWVVSRPMDKDGWIDPLLPRWYRKRLGLEDRMARRRVYLGSTPPPERRTPNEDAVRAFLVDRGYEVVDPAQLDTRAMVDLFSEVSHVVARSGSALANLVFAPSGARVVALLDPGAPAEEARLRFKALAEACGHQLAQIACKPSRAASHDGRAPIEVDLDVLRSALG